MFFFTILSYIVGLIDIPTTKIDNTVDKADHIVFIISSRNFTWTLPTIDLNLRWLLLFLYKPTQNQSHDKTTKTLSFIQKFIHTHGVQDINTEQRIRIIGNIIIVFDDNRWLRFSYFYTVN